MPQTQRETGSMRVKRVDPYDINVDEMNERQENVNTSELEGSVAEQGIIQPPIVRVRDEDAAVPYGVIVGQRRTMAAQAAGLDEIPVIVRDLDDAEALEASITENVDAFQEAVSPKDRAAAIDRLKRIERWNNQDVADMLGVSDSTVSEWLEYTRDAWEGTELHVDADPADDDPPGRNGTLRGDEATKTIAKVRRMTGGGEAGQRIVEQIQERELSRKDVQEVKERVDAGADPEAAVQTVADTKSKTQTATHKVELNTTVTDQKADAVEDIAKDYGMTTNEASEMLLTEALEGRGKL